MPPSTRNTLRITEIFYSLQGESVTVGIPTVFIRLTGCPLRCHYCDTSYAFHGGKIHSLENIVETVSSYNTRYITVTGGEPLAQPSCHELLLQLCDLGYYVSLETSGAMDIANVDQRVTRVMDLKTPGSGEMEKNRLSNLEHLRPHDQVKFVICSREDYCWARQQLQHYALDERCAVLFSPVYTELSAETLAQWVLDDQLNVRFQIQLHKLLWGEVKGK